MNSAALARPPVLVSLLGQWNTRQPWVVSCLRSWARLRGTAADWHVVSDGTLEQEDVAALAAQLPHLKIHFEEGLEERVAKALAAHPAITNLRRKNIVWRKLIDCALAGADETNPRLLIDTDVMVRRPVLLPGGDSLPPIVYQLDEISGYQGSWRAAWREPMVVSCNSGFVLFRPRLIDFDFLEYVARNYLPPGRDLWWSEQFAWSLLAGRTEAPHFWEGASAAVVCGYKTRTQAEIVANRVKFFSRKSRLVTDAQMRERCGDIPVIHLAGISKHLFTALLPGEDGVEPELLRMRLDTPLNFSEKIAVSSRLLLKELGDRTIAPPPG
jgi:hypothetical protein